MHALLRFNSYIIKDHAQASFTCLALALLYFTLLILISAIIWKLKSFELSWCTGYTSDTGID